jgi:hypothetical protein
MGTKPILWTVAVPILQVAQRLTSLHFDLGLGRRRRKMACAASGRILTVSAPEAPGQAGIPFRSRHPFCR